MTIDLSASEADMLREICESALSDLRMEVAGTENQGFRESLKRREGFLAALLEKLSRVSA
jgi:L-2-hydroxyglutarate oxidase LhgO